MRVNTRVCMANDCMNEATRDLDKWPLCARCKAKSNETERRWGPRVQMHDPATHARKELLGGNNS